MKIKKFGKLNKIKKTNLMKSISIYTISNKLKKSTSKIKISAMTTKIRFIF